MAMRAAQPGQQEAWKTVVRLHSRGRTLASRLGRRFLRLTRKPSAPQSPSAKQRSNCAPMFFFRAPTSKERTPCREDLQTLTVPVLSCVQRTYRCVLFLDILVCFFSVHGGKKHPEIADDACSLTFCGVESARAFRGLSVSAVGDIRCAEEERGKRGVRPRALFDRAGCSAGAAARRNERV